MGRLIWLMGEIIVGVLAGGVISGGFVPLAISMGLSTGPWVLWTCLLLSVGGCIAGGERLRRSLNEV